MCNVGGRVREGKPSKLWSNFGHGLKTPATGAVDFKRFAHSAEPNRLVVRMLGSWVAVWFSSFLVAVLLSCCLAASLACLLKKFKICSIILSIKDDKQLRV